MLVAYEIVEHPKHHMARGFASARFREGFALAPQTATRYHARGYLPDGRSSYRSYLGRPRLRPVFRICRNRSVRLEKAAPREAAYGGKSAEFQAAAEDRLRPVSAVHVRVV